MRAGKWDKTRQAQCLEEKQWPATTHGITHTHTHMSWKERLKGNWAKQVTSSLNVSGTSWKPKKTKTGRHPLSGVQCYTTMKWPWLHLNHMIRSFELLLGYYINPNMEECNFPQHNWPLAHSQHVLHNTERMVSNVKIANRCESDDELVCLC